MFDCHIHSTFSADSELDAIVACDTALEMGLEGIVFTDHLDIDFPSFDISFNIDFDLYDRYMDDLKSKYSGKLKVLKGIEVGITPKAVEPSLSIVRSHKFDYILASVHIVDDLDPYTPEYYRGKTKQTAYKRYLDQVLFMVRNFEDFDVCGHFDFVIRYAPYSDKSIYYKDFPELFDAIFKELVSKGKGLEINSGSYREIPRFIPYPSFDIEILKRFRQLGGKIVTLGSDSHQSDYIGYKFGYFKEMMAQAGFRYVAYYEDRKPVFEKIG